MITGVDFIGLPTRDLEAAVAFYGETLGLERSVYRPDRHHAEFETGNLTVNLMVAEKMGLPYVVSQNPIALHVDDVAESRATLAGRGVSFMGDIVDTACATWRSSRTPTGTRSCCTTATRRSRRAAAARLCARATLDPRKQRG
jgi:predicted enzyme related to lactoylglutathione lyase